MALTPWPPLPRCGRGVIWFVGSLLLRSSPLFSPRVGAEGFGGKVRGRPACSAAPALNPVPAWFRIVGDEASRHVPI